MQRHHTSGFTLVELLVTLVIAAISLAIGVPSFVEFVDKNELSSVSAEFVSTLQDARERAVSLGETVTIDQQEDEVSCTYSNDGGTEDCDGLDLADSDITIAAASDEFNDTNTIVFDSSGLTNGEYRLAVRHAYVETHVYEIRILHSGRISIKQRSL